MLGDYYLILSQESLVLSTPYIIFYILLTVHHVMILGK